MRFSSCLIFMCPRSWKLSGIFRGYFPHRIMLLLVNHRWNRRGLYVCTLSVCHSVCLSHKFSGLFLALRSHICMKLSSKPLYDELHIQFDFRHGWLTCSCVTALSLKFAIRTFLGYAFTFLNETRLQAFIWRVTVQVWLLSRLTYFFTNK